MQTREGPDNIATKAMGDEIKGCANAKLYLLGPLRRREHEGHPRRYNDDP